MEERSQVKSNVVLNTLRDVPVLSLCSKKELVYVSPEDTLGHVIGLLREHVISSVPVVDETMHAVGFLDMVDIVEYYISTLKNTSREVPIPDYLNTLWDTEASHLVGYSRRNGYAFVSEAEGTDVLLEKMGQGLVHRCCVGRTTGDKKHIPQHVISQTDVIRFLSTEYLKDGAEEPNESILKLAEIPIGDLMGEIPKRQTLIVDSQVSLLEACEILIQNSVSCIGITDEESGRLLSSFSYGDMKKWSRSDFNEFPKPVRDFLNTKGLEHRMPVTFKHTDSLRSVVNTLASLKIHSAWIVDDQFRPECVLTLTDIFRILLNLDQ